MVSGRTSAKLRKGMKCIVVDDEKIAREGLAEFIKEFDYLENLGLFANANLALEKLKTHSVDLIFLDIQMPLLSGLEFARIVADKQIMIIFTTAHLEYALDGYRVNSVGYLLKPIFFENFELAVQKAKKMYDSIHRSEVEYDPLFLKEDGMLVKVYPTQVMYIKGLQNYVELNLENGKRMIIHQTLKSIVDLFPREIFIQIHKSYIVNTTYISKIDGSMLYLRESTLPIARDRRKDVLNVIKEI